MLILFREVLPGNLKIFVRLSSWRDGDELVRTAKAEATNLTAAGRRIAE